MEGNLFDKVSNEKLDMLYGALSEVISDMRYAGESVDATFTDEAFWACLSIRNMVFAALRRHEINKGCRL
ncbi:MAG: S-adenosylmethionine synthetase [Prevotella sp.]|nr:S-adenosylmethionine synthetase [Prevotella sp.]